MGAGGSTLTKSDVNDIIDEQEFVKASDLAGYAKTTSLADYAKITSLADYARAGELNSYAKLTALSEYLNKTTDKVSDTTLKTDNSKWVTPKWVTDNAVTANVSETTVAQKLADNSTFRNNLITPLSESVRLQTGIATGLLNDDNKSNFLSSLNAEFTTSDQFKTELANTLTSNEVYRSALRGQPGSFNSATVQRVFWSGGSIGGTATEDGSKVLWCADGDLCKVPKIKKGIVFTGDDQILSGSGESGFKTVKIDDHLAFNMGGTIDLTRNKAVIGTGTGSLGPNDGKILANIEKPDATATNAQMENAALEIHGIGRLKGDNNRIPKKIKMVDNVEVGGDLVVKGNIIMGTENGKRILIHKNTVNNDFHIAADKNDGTWDWDNQIILNRSGQLNINNNVTITSSGHEAIRIKPKHNANWNYIRFADVNNTNRAWIGLNNENRSDSDGYVSSQYFTQLQSGNNKCLDSEQINQQCDWGWSPRRFKIVKAPFST